MLTVGCSTCRVTIVDSTAPKAPAWLTKDDVGATTAAPTRRDAVQAAQIAAAMNLIEGHFGVLMGATYKEATRFSTKDGDQTDIEQKLRTEARGFIRWRPIAQYAERVTDSCAPGPPTWRAWARVRVDPRELRAGLDGWLSARTTARARVSVSGSTVSVSAPSPVFVAVVSQDRAGNETIRFGGRLRIGQVVERRLPDAVALRVFVSNHDVPADGGKQLHRLYRCLSDSPARRCGLIHRDIQ